LERAVRSIEKSDENRIVILWLFNIAMEKWPIEIDDFPIKSPFIRDFPWLC
jgi:hypothetical protein